MAIGHFLLCPDEPGKAEAPRDLTPPSSWTHLSPDLSVLLPLVASHPPPLTPPYLPDKFLCPVWADLLSPRLLHTGQSMQLERPSSGFSCQCCPYVLILVTNDTVHQGAKPEPPSPLLSLHMVTQSVLGFSQLLSVLRSTCATPVKDLGLFTPGSWWTLFKTDYTALQRASQSRAMAFSTLFFGGRGDSPFPIEVQRFLNIEQGLGPGYFEILLGLP